MVKVSSVSVNLPLKFFQELLAFLPLHTPENPEYPRYRVDRSFAILPLPPIPPSGCKQFFARFHRNAIK
jgi:hypothetical protein